MGYMWNEYKESQEYGVDQSEFDAKKKRISEKEQKEEEKRNNIISQISKPIDNLKEIIVKIKESESELDSLPEFEFEIEVGDFAFKIEKKLVLLSKRDKQKYLCYKITQTKGVDFVVINENETMQIGIIGLGTWLSSYKAVIPQPYLFDKLGIN